MSWGFLVKPPIRGTTFSPEAATLTRNFLLYWRPKTVERHLVSRFLLENAGSNQLGRVAPRDTLWIVTTGEAHDLCLVGRLRVGEVVTLKEAHARLGTSDLWPSRYHALAAPGTAEPMRAVSLSDVVHRLRFINSAARQFSISSFGGVHPEQLRVMRELDQPSCTLLLAAFIRSKLIEEEYC